jgi:hypothetical protein
MLTDEPLEANAPLPGYQGYLNGLIEKIHALGVMLFLVGPKSAGLETLAEADKSQYQQVGQTQDGLGTLDFGRVLAHIGKSVSVSTLQAAPEKSVRRATFNQDRWIVGQGEIRGGT